MSRWTGPAVVGVGWGAMRWDGRPRGLVGFGGEVCLASPGVGLGSLCCRRGSSGLIHLLGWPSMCSEDLKTGLSGRPFPQYLNAQWGPAVGSSGDQAWVSLGRS